MMLMRMLIVILGMRMHEYDNEGDAGACWRDDGEDTISSPVRIATPLYIKSMHGLMQPRKLLYGSGGNVIVGLIVLMG